MSENKYKNEANPYKVGKVENNAPVDYNFEKMLKIFMKQVQKDGILREVKARRYYIKPSDKKRAERNKRIRKCI